MIAGFLFAATLIAITVAAALIFPGRLLAWLARLNPAGMAAFRAMGRSSGALLLVVGALAAASAAGLLQRKRWAWRLAIALFTVNACGDVVSFFITRDLFRSAAGVAVCAGFLYGLLRKDMRTWFTLTT